MKKVITLAEFDRFTKINAERYWSSTEDWDEIKKEMKVKGNRGYMTLQEILDLVDVSSKAKVHLGLHYMDITIGTRAFISSGGFACDCVELVLRDLQSSTHCRSGLEVITEVRNCLLDISKYYGDPKSSIFAAATDKVYTTYKKAEPTMYNEAYPFANSLESDVTYLVITAISELKAVFYHGIQAFNSAIEQAANADIERGSDGHSRQLHFLKKCLGTDLSVTHKTNTTNAVCHFCGRRTEFLFGHQARYCPKCKK